MRILRAFVVFVSAAIVGGVAGVAPGLTPARAGDCPGNPKALGTSRVLVLEPGEFKRVGVMQYPDSLPLGDKEVVLTFDDGPLPPYSTRVLDILAAQCVKATYFLVGRMAHEFPAVVRRIREEGHSIGTHSEDHPFRMDRLPVEKVRREIDGGITDVAQALGDPTELAPFFRIPGLARSDVIEHELAARALVVFSSDTVADDWFRRIKPNEIIRRAVHRLEERGKGILLLHDIHPATALALPGLLNELRERGFHIVHVVPAPASRIEIAGAPRSSTPPPTADLTDAALPKLAAGQLADRIMPPAPDASSSDADDQPAPKVVLAEGSESAKILAFAGAATQGPDRSTLDRPTAEAELPAPIVHDLGLAAHRLQITGRSHVLRASLAASEPSEPRHRRIVKLSGSGSALGEDRLHRRHLGSRAL